MPGAKVNGVEVALQPGTTVLQVVECAGVVSRFRHTERLGLTGDRRVRLVEMTPAHDAIPVAAE